MSPMEVTDGTPPTTRWVPQTEPLDLNEPLGYVTDFDDIFNSSVGLEDLDASVQHRIESWPEAAELLRRSLMQQYCRTGIDPDRQCNCVACSISKWLAANAPEESP